MLSALRRIFNIAISELIKVVTDEGCVLIMVGGIFLYGLFYTLPFSAHVLREVPIAVVDNDNSALSREFIRMLDSSEFILVKSRPEDSNMAKQEYYRNNIRAFVVIPSDFEKDIKRGKQAAIASYEDSSFLIIYKQVATGIQTVANSFGAKTEVAGLMKQGLSKEQALNIKKSFEFVENPLYNPVGSYQNYLLPIILLLIFQQTMLAGVGILNGTINERIRGVKQLINGKVEYVKLKKINEFSDKSYEIVLGKNFAYIFLYIIYTILYFGIIPFIAVYPMNNNILISLLYLIPFFFATGSLAQAMAMVCKHRETAFFLLVVLSVPIMFLTGFIWPNEAMPFCVKWIAKAIPSTPTVDALIRINQMHANFTQVFHDYINLIILCTAYFVLACMVVDYLKKLIERQS